MQARYNCILYEHNYMDDFLARFDKFTRDLLHNAGSLRGLVIILAALLAAFLASRTIAWLVVRAAQFIAVRSDITSNEERAIKLRRVETYLSVTVAVLKGLVVMAIAYFTVLLLLPKGGALATTIGAGTFFVVFANATIAPLLRDITSGATMIIERWFSVGDFIRVEPFAEVGGVVERVTLRSTKLRNLNGEAIWLHNQYIQAVKTTPHGVRTMAIDVFVRELSLGMALVRDVCRTLPTSPTMLARPLRVTNKEELAPSLWKITMVGQTAPGREWLIEQFITNALKDADKEGSGKRVIIYGPLVRNADELAEKRFRRAVRVARQQPDAAGKP